MTNRHARRCRRQAVVRMVAALLLAASGSGGAIAQATLPAPSNAPVETPPPPAVPPAAPTASKPAAAVGTPATVVDDKQIESVLGKSVQSPKDEDMGRIVDVLIDRTGDVRAAVIDFGGFFGVGSRKIAVDWHSLHFKTSDKENAIVADLPPDELRTAPVYKDGEPVVIVGGPAAPASPVPPAATPLAPTPATPAAPAIK